MDQFKTDLKSLIDGYVNKPNTPANREQIGKDIQTLIAAQFTQLQNDIDQAMGEVVASVPVTPVAHSPTPEKPVVAPATPVTPAPAKPPVSATVTIAKPATPTPAPAAPVKPVTPPVTK